MGTWNCKIDGNDTFHEACDDFLEEYASCKSIEETSAALLKQYRDNPEGHIACFAVAYCQWQYGKLSKELYDKAVALRKTDLLYWKDCGASDSMIEKRSKELDKFFAKLKSENRKPLNPPYQITKEMFLSKGEVVWYRDSGKIYGAVVLEILLSEYFLIAVSDELESIPKNKEDVFGAKLYTAAWFDSGSLLKKSRFRIIDVYKPLYNLDYHNRAGMFISDENICITNPGQISTWKHSFYLLKYRNALVRDTFVPKFLPQTRSPEPSF